MITKDCYNICSRAEPFPLTWTNGFNNFAAKTVFIYYFTYMQTLPEPSPNLAPAPGPMSCDQRSCPSSCSCPSCRTPGPFSRLMRCSSTPSSSTCVWPCPRTESPLCLRSSNCHSPFSSLCYPTSRRTSRCKSR